jgi:predicted DNA binding CopG/RHH family protein
MKKPFPDLKSDEEAEAFVANADLSEYDFSQFKPTHFEFKNKSARVNFRLPEPLLRSVKARAAERGMPYQRFIREALENALATPARPAATSVRTRKRAAS